MYFCYYLAHNYGLAIILFTLISKIAQVTFFAAAFAVLFSGTADAYIAPSVMNYAIQAVAGVIIAVGAAAGIYWRKAKKIDKSLGIDENKNKEVESDDTLGKMTFPVMVGA